MASNKLRRKLYKYLPLMKLLLPILAFCVFIYFFVYRLLPPVSHLYHSFSRVAAKISLRNSKGRVNILLLGEGGGNHTAPDLTDTIIFASVNIASGETVLVSIPRDIWIDSMKAKINTAYHYGEEKREGGGLILSKAVVSEILGQPIQYAVLLDFDGLVKAVDLVGGVDINVERAFDDYKYPIPGKEDAEPENLRYEHLHFDAGLQHMDGKMVLKYVRSRYAQGEEGTDFARSKRQENFLASFKKKFFSVKTLLNFQTLKGLNKAFADSVKTDIAPAEYPEFFKLILKMKNAEIKSSILDESLLYHPKEKIDGQWVLLPKNGSWKQMQEYVKSLLE